MAKAEGMDMDGLRREGLSPGRRVVLNWLLGGAVGTFLVAALYPVVRFLTPQRAPEGGALKRVLVGGGRDFPEGSFKKFRLGRYPCIALNYQGSYYAYGAICTHLGCIVNWDAGRAELHCPCHDGFFDPKTGKVLAGPPPSPLPKVSLVKEGGEVYAEGWEDPQYVKKLTTYG